MALMRIDEVYVYTCSGGDPVGTHQLHAWFDHSGIEHTKLDYPSPGRKPEVLGPLNTWWQPDDAGITQPPLTDFPFVVYTEVHSDRPVSYLPRRYIYGSEAIIEQLPTLYAMGR